MPRTYSTYEAKARFSEIVRRVRHGETVYVSYRGKEVAEIRPVPTEQSVESALERLRGRGVISGPPAARPALKPIAKRPGALKRFLESRD